MSSSDRWHLLQQPAGAAAYNMAVDESLLRTAAQRNRPLLRLYSWQRPALSIGYFQKFPADQAGQYDIVRRPTGGGLVYHGHDTTYTVVVPPGHALYRLTTAEAYCAIHQAVAGALPTESELVQQALPARGTYECFRRPVAGDVVAGNQKLAGGAQRRNRDGMLHQGSIAASVTGDLPAAFQRHFGIEFIPYTMTGEECTITEWLAEGKYQNEAWTKRVT